MTNIYIDIETKGLNAKEFVSGAILFDTVRKEKIEYFSNPRMMWNRIIDIGYKQGKKNMLNVYAFNTKYDFYGIANFETMENGKIEIFCEAPFIANYKDNKTNKTIIKFLDVMSIYTGHSLDRAGKLIGSHKGFTPTILKNKTLFNIATNDNDDVITKMAKILASEEAYKEIGESKELYMEVREWCELPYFMQLQKINKYLKQDLIVTRDLIDFVKKKLKEENISLRRIYTISQIAMGRMLMKLKENNIGNFFSDESKNEVHKNNWNFDIRKSYKGGRCEVFGNAGQLVNDVQYIDVNSLYPYALSKIDIPKLNTCRKIINPLKHNDLSYILSKIGTSECIVKVSKNDSLGLLPTRTIDGNYYGKSGQVIVGNWTHLELNKALNLGYKILNVKQSIIFDTNIKDKNVFKNIIDETYNKRKSSNSDFDNWFYKMMMNSAIGKFAQYRLKGEIVIDDVEKIDEYISKGYIRTTNIGFNYIYKKELNLSNAKHLEKSYYTPIISSYVNAYSRCHMYDIYSLIDKEDRLYSDTDSLIFKNNIKYNKILEPYLSDTEFGKLKIEHNNEMFLCFGKKNYAIGDNVKVSGYKQRNMKFEDFAKGDITSLKMIGIKSGNFDKVGTFIEEKHNLRESLIKQENFNNKWDSNKVIIDCDIEDIDFYKPILKQLLK